MIDFTGCKGLVNSYEGADFKRKIIYDGDVYMLKFGQKLESDERKPMQASYASTPVSEYLGSHIYALAGLPTQHTMLGTCNGKTVVACRDFIESRPDAEDVTLVEFKKLENSFLGSSTAGGRTPSLDNLLDIFSEHDYLESIRDAAEERYWQMFAVDSLIGNFDRHAGNWGYILDRRKNAIIDLAPVYDCGSSLYPALNEAAMANFIKDRDSLVKRVLDFPRATEQTGEQVARLLGTGQFRLPRHEHLVVLVLHHVTPIHKRVGGEPNRAPPPTPTCNHPQERMCRHHSTLSSAPVRIPVLRVPAAGILDGTLAKVTYDLGTLIQTVGEERVTLIAEVAKPSLNPRRVAGIHPQALLALD